MATIVGELRSTKEKSLHVSALVVGAVLWLGIIFWGWNMLTSPNPQLSRIAWVYAAYGVGLALFYLISSAAYRATAFGNMVLLGPRQFPELWEMVVSGSRALGLTGPPKTFLYNSQGVFNAFARRLMGGRYVFLTSALIEADSDEQVRFVIGHELGHHAAGHLNPWLNFLKLPAHLIPFLMPAYSRSREYSCDRIGARLSPELAAAESSLQMLGCGCRRLNSAMDRDAFTDQEKMMPPIMGFLTEIFRTHPRLTRRILALGQHAKQTAR